MNILLIDNADSFTHNLVHLVKTSFGGARVRVEPYASTIAGVSGSDLVIISPGPGHPREYPAYTPLLDTDTPVLGICLGLQIINEHFGGSTDRLPGCVHGRTDEIEFLGSTRTVARYHSLAVSRTGEGLELLAKNRDGVVMALGSRARRKLGYQFHPESFLTPDGGEYLGHAARFLGLS